MTWTHLFCSFICSGFEDDFSVSDFKVTSGMTTRSTTFSSDPFDCIDDFSAPLKTNNFQPSNIRNVKPTIQPKPTIGSSSFYTCTSNIEPTNNFDDSLSNGKSLIKPASVSMPTIIKPIVASKGKSSPTHVEAKKPATVLYIHQESVSDESYDEFPSLPMPTIPPPPPPIVVDDDVEETSAYGFALFDFESDVVEDLNLRVSCASLFKTVDSKCFLIFARLTKKFIYSSTWMRNGCMVATSEAVKAFSPLVTSISECH